MAGGVAASLPDGGRLRSARASITLAQVWGAGAQGKLMARRKESGFEVVASMPWQLGIALGLIGYLAIRYGLGGYLGATGNPYLAGLGRSAASGIFAPLGWMLLIGCWIAALVSFLGRTGRRKRLDALAGVDGLRAMHWRDFEMLTGEAFRRHGYSVAENGLAEQTAAST